MKRVLISEGGRRFHKDASCQASERAHLIWDSDEFTAPSHPGEWVTIPDAMSRGKEACATCFPGLRASWYRGASENDFGHEPVSNDVDYWGETTDDPPVCARCSRWISAFSPVVVGQELDGRVITSGVQLIRFEVAVLWPCTSAIVLGLVDRTEVAA